MWARKQHGFTIVELLIVIVVIAILAAITIVAYNGITVRARDSLRKSDISEVGKAIQIYATSNSNYVESGSGCGVSGNGNGWLSAGPSDLGASLYPRSIINCLQDNGILKPGQFTDPSGCVYDSGGKCGVWQSSPAQAYMKATCQKGGVKITYLYAHLEGSAPYTASVVDATCDAGTVSGFTASDQKWGTNYGMNYYLAIQ